MPKLPALTEPQMMEFYEGSWLYSPYMSVSPVALVDAGENAHSRTYDNYTFHIAPPSIFHLTHEICHAIYLHTIGKLNKLAQRDYGYTGGYHKYTLGEVMCELTVVSYQQRLREDLVPHLIERHAMPRGWYIVSFVKQMEGQLSRHEVDMMMTKAYEFGTLEYLKHAWSEICDYAQSGGVR